MQHLNYFTLKSLADWLREQLLNGKWLYSFSQSKDELVVVLKGVKSKIIFLRIGCGVDFQYVVPEVDFKRSTSNTVNLFQNLENQTIQNIYVVKGDRVLIIQLAHNHFIAFKMYGNRSNIILFQQFKPISLFRSEIESDLALTLPFPDIELYDNEVVTIPQLKTAFPYLDKYLIAKIQHYEQQGDTLPIAYQKLIDEAQNKEYFITNPTEPQLPDFFIIQPIDSPELIVKQGIAESLNYFLRKRFYSLRYQKISQTLHKQLNTQLKSIEKKILSATETLQKLTHLHSPEELANIIMANLHLLKPNSKTADIPDIYNDNELITITLNPNLTPQQNAEHYYQLQKQNKIKLEQSQQHLSQSQNQQNQLLTIQNELNNATTFDLLKILLQKYPELNPKSLKSVTELPFRLFSKENYTIYVGKNAENNDKLLAFAHKDDIWLHAKDVSGSHVVIKTQNKTTLPKTVLEYAASLAAYYSKNRNQSLVAVCFTQKKYVRKRKGLAAGQVIVEKEQVILIPPFQKDKQ